MIIFFVSMAHHFSEHASQAVSRESVAALIPLEKRATLAQPLSQNTPKSVQKLTGADIYGPLLRSTQQPPQEDPAAPSSPASPPSKQRRRSPRKKEETRCSPRETVVTTLMEEGRWPASSTRPLHESQKRHLRGYVS